MTRQFTYPKVTPVRPGPGSGAKAGAPVPPAGHRRSA
jgi:hypothetical protein